MVGPMSHVCMYMKLHLSFEFKESQCMYVKLNDQMTICVLHLVRSIEYVFWMQIKLKPALD
jgi:hypothetical protein